MAKWIDNLKSIVDNGNAGDCPLCHSHNTDFSIKKTRKDMGYGVVWCNDCHKAFHISRINISGIKSMGNSDVPKSLIY